MHETLYLTEQLLSRASLTPQDAGCQDLLAARLQAPQQRLGHDRVAYPLRRNDQAARARLGAGRPAFSDGR